jgi:hypothetical protein
MQVTLAGSAASGTGKGSLQVLDWEVGSLHWKCLRSTDGDEPRRPESELARFGVVDERRRSALHHAACTGAVMPCAAALLGTVTAHRPDTLRARAV